MVTTIDELISRGVALRSPCDSLDTTAAGGRFQLSVFVAMAQYQRALSAEQVQDALQAPRARRVQRGHKTALTPEQARDIHRMRRAGLSQDQAHRSLGVFTGAVGPMLSGEMMSLAHVSLELPEDEMDVRDAVANDAICSAQVEEKEA